MEILSKQREVEVVRYERHFQYKTDPELIGCCSFPVDRNGNLLVETMRYGFDEVSRSPDYIDLGIKEFRYNGTEPTVGLCDCGAKVYLDESFDGLTECECGRLYFMDGTELEPAGLAEAG